MQKYLNMKCVNYYKSCGLSGDMNILLVSTLWSELWCICLTGRRSCRNYIYYHQCQQKLNDNETFLVLSSTMIIIYFIFFVTLFIYQNYLACVVSHKTLPPVLNGSNKKDTYHFWVKLNIKKENNKLIPKWKNRELKGNKIRKK